MNFIAQERIGSERKEAAMLRSANQELVAVEDKSCAKLLPIGKLFMLIILVMATWGVGYGLWSKKLTIRGIVSTGSVNAEFLDVFTDDDNRVDDPDRDSQDTGKCKHGPWPMGVDPDQDQITVEQWNIGCPQCMPRRTSCDPAASGPDPKPHYDKDVAECYAERYDEDPDQEGDQNASVEILNGYPSYYCTAWFQIHNNGSVPVKVLRILIVDEEGNILVEDAQPSTVYALDLTGPEGDPDGEPDLDLHVTDIELKEQIDPSEKVLMDLDMHVRQEAPQRSQFVFDVQVELAQWNEVE
jgi:hypothetical protein